MCQSIAGKHPGDQHSNLRKDMTSNEFVVAGQHLHGDPGGCHPLDRAPRASLRRIKKNGEAGENEVALVVDRGGLMTRTNQAAGKTQRSEPLRAECFKCRLEGATRLVIQRVLLARRRLVSSREPE